MAEQPLINITVSGYTGTGKSTMAYLIADFLSTTGFNVELNLLDDFNVEEFEKTFTDKLESIEQANTKIIVNEVQTKRNGIELYVDNTIKM